MNPEKHYKGLLDHLSFYKSEVDEWSRMNRENVGWSKRWNVLHNMVAETETAIEDFIDEHPEVFV